MPGASIYILRCADGTYYTGITRRSVDERVSEHAQGLVESYTARRLPVELIFSETYERVDEAIAAERRIKGKASDRKVRSGLQTNPMRLKETRAKKEAYMRGEFELLSELARRKRKPSF